MKTKILINIKGINLLELMFSVLIVGVLAAVAIPRYTTMVEQGASASVQNNLLAIASGQQIFYFNNGYYYSSAILSGDPSPSPNSTPCSVPTPSPSANDNALNTNLNLNIPANNFSYTCEACNSGYFCIAWDGTNMLTYDKSIPPNNVAFQSCCGATSHGACPTDLTCNGGAAYSF